MNSEGRLKIYDIFIWKEKADDIIGEELDEFAQFIGDTYSKKKAKFSFTMKELRAALVSWMKYENLRRNGKLDAPQTETETMDAVSIVQDDGQFIFQDPEGLEMELHNLRQRGLDLLNMKMENHSEKIREIFERHIERPDSDSDGEGKKLSKDEQKVRIQRLGRVMNDIGSFVGIAFNTFNAFLSNLHDTKKTDKGVVKQLQHYMWLKNHKEKIAAENKPMKGILKEPTQNFKDPDAEDSDSDDKAKPKESFSLRWEDELFKKEKNTGLDADQFIKYLTKFYEDTEILVFDHMKEFDKELDANFKAETDATFDPVREQIENTLRDYQKQMEEDEKVA